MFSLQKELFEKKNWDVVDNLVTMDLTWIKLFSTFLIL